MKPNQSQWWQIAVNNQTAEILLYDEINDMFGIDAKQFTEDLNALGDDVKTINLRINSPGGSVFQGVAIYNAISRHPATVNVFIDGIAFSMASGIAMAGDTVEMCENGLMMIHDPQAVAMGDESEMSRTAKMLSKTKSALMKAYMAKTGRSEEEIGDMMSEETYMTAEEALELGFIDAINECKQMAASFDVDSLDVPSHLRGVVNSLFSSKEPTMATGQNAGAKPATLQELEELNNDPAFVVNSLKGELTLDGAMKQLIKDQKETIDCLTDENQKLRVDNGAKEDTLRRMGTSQIPDPAQQSSQAKADPAPQPARANDPKPAPQPTNDPPKPAAVGNDAVNISATNQLPPAEWDGDAHAFFRKAKNEIKAELQAAGRKFTVNDILRAVHDKYPELENAMRSQLEG